jgi:hypothetical protein
MTSKGKARETTSKLTRRTKPALLDTFELTDTASRNVWVINVNHMFENRISETPAAADPLIKLTRKNKIKELSERTGELDKAENIKAAERKAEEIAKESNYTIQQKETAKHIVRLKNKNRKLPTFELQ